MLVSRHVPHLEDAWDRDASDEYVSRTHGMRLLHDGNAWLIVQDGFALARSYADALHPNTVLAGEWEVCVTYPDGWKADPRFAVHLARTASDVVTMDDVGRDFFVRVPQTRPVRFVDPATGEVHTSGAKHDGRRYCHLCDRLYSGNNFVSQHLRLLHPSEWARVRTRQDRRRVSDAPDAWSVSRDPSRGSHAR